MRERDARILNGPHKTITLYSFGTIHGRFRGWIVCQFLTLLLLLLLLFFVLTYNPHKIVLCCSRSNKLYTLHICAHIHTALLPLSSILVFFFWYVFHIGRSSDRNLANRFGIEYLFISMDHGTSHSASHIPQTLSLTHTQTRTNPHSSQNIWNIFRIRAQ